jgi:propanol-preferring alcohol dehydrogenase
MRCAVLQAPGDIATDRLRIVEREAPEPSAGEVRLKVRACGICRTDLHIVEGELPVHREHVIPGHQIVGIVDACGPGVMSFERGTRVGVSWIGGIDGTCSYCITGRENLCDHPTFTGYDVDGGYAEYAVARADFCHRLDPRLDDLHAAPLLCAGIIGFRALRVAGLKPGETVGLFGFGASAHLALPVLKAWNCTVAVATRGETHRAMAARMGADWVGDALDRPPHGLDRAVTFAPSGDVVVSALASLRKGGVVAINAIHLDRIPSFDYDSLLWGEREIRSVTNMTREDARDFLALSAEIGLAPQTTSFTLERANDALRAVKSDAIDGAAVLTIAQE